MLLTSKKWHVSSSFAEKDTDALMGVLLKNRNIETPDQKEAFLADGDGVWHNPYDFKGMREAVDLIVSCMEAGRKVLVYGDYDCDGVTATSILVRYFRSHNVNVDYIVPHRAEHGYGLTENIIDKVLEAKPDLLITVDCGVTNLETVAALKEAGVMVIVTDHHTVKEEIPNADAVICAKRADNTYPFTDLCGAGVALKLIEALGRDQRYKVSGKIWKQSIELAGIATIADLVSVVDENRTIIKKAFKSMENPVNPGVRVMNEMLLDNGKKLDETFISFNFVPRINAAGRLYDSSDALRLFLEDDEKVVREAAYALGRENDERKQIESGVFAEAQAQVESPARPEEWQLTNTKGPIVVYGKNWHQGVLGIVAGKLSQYFRRSAIVFTDDPLDPGNVKGSGRAYGEYDLFGSLSKVAEYCVNFGGHRKAAGIVVAKDKMAQFMRALEKAACDDLISDEDETDEEDDDVLEINAEIPFEQLTYDTYKQVSVLKPFGIGNKKPVFCTRGLLIVDIQPMSEGVHMRMDLKKAGDMSDTIVSAVGFGMGQYLDILKAGDKVDLAYTMNEYTYRGRTSLSLHIEDIVPVYEDSFLWRKPGIAEELYRKGMAVEQIGKLAGGAAAMAGSAAGAPGAAGTGSATAGLIPDAECFKASYRVLYERCKNGISTADTLLLAKMIGVNSGLKITPFQTGRCLDIFSEAGLIKLGIVNPTRVCYSFIKDPAKADLKTTETYKRLCGNG